MVRISGSFEDP